MMMMQCMQSMIIHDIGKRKSSYFLLEFINPKSNIYIFLFKGKFSSFSLKKNYFGFFGTFFAKNPN